MGTPLSDIKGWVRVAGTGQKHGLPEAVIWTAEALGRALCREGYGLVTGGYPGVDHIASRAFADEHQARSELLEQRRPLSRYLVHFVPKGREPDFRDGEVVTRDTEHQSLIDSLKKADVIVLTGGKGGTYDAYTHARQEQCPTFPIAGTGGDARRIFDRMLSQWVRPPLTGITKDDFAECLGMAITKCSDADRVIEKLMRLLHDHWPPGITLPVHDGTTSKGDVTMGSPSASREPSLHPKPAARYSTAAIRRLVEAAFTPQTLSRFCQDQPDFRHIVAEFGPGQSLRDMVDRVIAYCDTRLLFGELLAEIEKENPRQYERFQPYRS